MSSYRSLTLFIFFTTLLVCSAILSISLGPAQISNSDIIQHFLSFFQTSIEQPILNTLPTWKQNILEHVRLPRTVLAMLVGASLALCGLVLQALFNNPLASPSVLGVSSGASLGAVIAIFFGLAQINIWMIPCFAFIGALLTLFAVYQLANERGRIATSTLLLAGIAVGAFNVAMSSLVLALSLDNWDIGKSIVYWTMGSLDGKSWAQVALILPLFLISALSIHFLYARTMNILMLGETHAASLGVDVSKVRLTLLMITSLLCAACISVAGGISFIGLIVPHLCRLIIGNDHHQLVPFSIIMGALVLVLADSFLRFHPSLNAIPLGVITASLGAPFFIFLLHQQKHRL